MLKFMQASEFMVQVGKIDSVKSLDASRWQL